MVDGKETIELLRKRFPDAVVVSDDWRDQHWAQVRAIQFVEVCEWLRDDPRAIEWLGAQVPAVPGIPYIVVLEVLFGARNAREMNRLRKQVSAHLKVARRHAKRIAAKHGAGSRALRDARAVRDLLDDARGQLAKGG